MSTEPRQDDLDQLREQLARRLRETREYVGLSQQEAGDASGLGRVVISAIETGRRRVESVELGALARAYGQPVEYFLAPADAAGAGASEVRHIARAAEALAPEDRSELLRFAQFLKTYRAPAKR